MKFLLSLVLIFSTYAFSQEIKVIESNTEEETILELSYVIASINLYEDLEKDIHANLIVSFSGKSTDVSPNYKVSLGFMDAGEMNNIRSSFTIGNFVTKPEIELSIGEGIVIKGLYFNQDDFSFKKVEISSINLAQLLKDNQEMQMDQFEDFTDPYLKSQISLKLKEIE